MRDLARETGVQVYLVGGPVRDALLGAPVLDLDFSVVANAPGLARMLAERLGGRITAHARFGTATVSSEGLRVDLVTARRESYRRPGTLPEVTPGSIADDLARRDFTINAMALPLGAGDAGVLDPLGGLDDLQAGVVRFLHPLSFVDDPTRMVRAVRYEQRFGFRIDEETLAGMSLVVSAGHMDAVSGDRWRHELQRILEEGNPVAPLLRAAKLGLMGGLHPALGKLAGDGKGGLHRLDSLRRERGAVDTEYCIAALFSALSASEGEGVIQRLRLTGRQATLARDTIGLRDSEAEIRASVGFPSELARILKEKEPEAVSAWAEFTDDQEVAGGLRRYARELRFVRPELSGDELLAMGVAEGPEVGEILTALRDARLDGRVNNVEEERALVWELLAGVMTERAK